MATTPLIVDDWIEKIRQSGTKKELFEILGEFQKLDWADSQRAEMSDAYMKVLDRILEEEEENASSESDTNEEVKDDGPVWYEKM